jgi:glycosyltransferase involved in cell wall biosynthesis
MDGLEWRRAKFKPSVQRFLMFAEKLAINKSDYLISDSIGIKSYLKKKYNIETAFIAYGADIFKKPEISFIQKYNLSENSYNLLIARIEPENNIEIIIKGVVLSKDSKVLLIIGDYKRNTFGKELFDKYNQNTKIRFLGSIYNKEVLNNLRYYSYLYFHGHSVGGTNPSLLEAMGCSCLIIAHDNEFNKAVLEQDAYYFTTPENLAEVIKNYSANKYSSLINSNLNKISNYYNVNNINGLYEQLFIKCLRDRRVND